MFDGIRRFQKANGLKVDGFIRPGGPTERAINQQVAGGGGYRAIDSSSLFRQFDRFASKADDPEEKRPQVPNFGNLRHSYVMLDHSRPRGVSK